MHIYGGGAVKRVSYIFGRVGVYFFPSVHIVHHTRRSMRVYDPRGIRSSLSCPYITTTIIIIRRTFVYIYTYIYWKVCAGRSFPWRVARILTRSPPPNSRLLDVHNSRRGSGGGDDNDDDNISRPRRFMTIIICRLLFFYRTVVNGVRRYEYFFLSFSFFFFMSESPFFGGFFLRHTGSRTRNVGCFAFVT